MENIKCIECDQPVGPRYKVSSVTDASGDSIGSAVLESPSLITVKRFDMVRTSIGNVCRAAKKSYRRRFSRALQTQWNPWHPILPFHQPPQKLYLSSTKVLYRTRQLRT